jgi:hypothetical protein
MMQLGYRPQLRMPQSSSMSQQHQQPLHHHHHQQQMHQIPLNQQQQQMMMPPPVTMMGGGNEIGFDGKMLRKSMARKTVDYNPSATLYLEVIFH